MPSTTAFIGAGNIAHSLIGGLIQAGVEPTSLWVSNPSQEKLQRLQSSYGINITTDNQQAAKHAQTIVLCVKPQVMHQVATDLASVINKKQLIISTAAGILIDSLQQWMPQANAIIRCMPNTPSLVGSGATGLYASDNASEQDKERAEHLMRYVGICVWLDKESDIDTVMALSACGPAYYFLVMESLQKAAIEQGLSSEVAHLLTIQTALGAAHLALNSSSDLAQLWQQVASKGGSTELALQVLEQGQIRQLMADALSTAKQRAIELSKTKQTGESS